MPDAPFADRLRPGTAALFTDLYQLTMLQAYHREGMEAEATFSLFARRLKDRHYLVACGLEHALRFLETLRFSDEALAFVAAQPSFDGAFVEALADVRFTGDVYAVPEGTPVFPDEPLLEVVAPLGEAQLVETMLLNQLTFATGVASKAARVVEAAGADRTVADFGMRRTHGAEAAQIAARASYLAGADATSNVAAGHAYGIPVTGTMAHSYVEAHDREADAFRAFADLYPETVLLVDTYDTLGGVQKVIDLAEELGDAFAVRGIRLDSGDLAALAKDARRLLDDAGLTEVDILASSSLDEYAIADLLAQGAPIDGFGVGTRMGTVADHPALDTAYKLCGYDGTPRMKLAKDKSNLPGRKQVYRQHEGGTMARDVIATAEEPAPAGTPLLEQVMAGGTRTEAGRARPVAELRTRFADARATLPARLRTLDDGVAPYPVVLSDALEAKVTATQEALRARMG
jgi:nicotinate phosphoribosyltransferase